MTGFEGGLLLAYFVVVGVLAVYGSHRYQMVYLYYRNRQKPKEPLRHFADDELPAVTVQLPVFNERFVVERLIDSVARLDYPRDRLEVQVLDDSTDETVAISRRKVDEWHARGLDVRLLRRENRHGFKAGALAEGLKEAKGELVVIFDADFTPEPDMLRRTVHYFSDPKVGLVQTRWGHLNNGYSLFTEVQGILLDGHLQIEQTARNRSGRFFNFNGTGGIWRRAAIVAAGGWHHDTLTEDLDISFRAQLKGWEFIFLPDVVSPAELPVDINAYKTQQHRWTKGAVQCAKKLLPSVWRSEASLKQKIEATFQLTMNSAYVLMVLLSVLMLPMVTIRFERGWVGFLIIDVPFCVCATTSVFSFYICSQREVYPGTWWKRMKYIPMVISVGIGMCLTNAKAVLEGLFGYGEREFVRTAKHGIVSGDGGAGGAGDGRGGRPKARKYTRLKTLLPVLELAFGCYFAFAVGLAYQSGRYAVMPFLTLFLVGFTYVATLSILHAREARAAGGNGGGAGDGGRAAGQPVLEEAEEAVAS